MKILITAGGTTEKIDNVRELTNIATGRLGSLIADEFMNAGDAEVIYICPKNAIIPRNRSCRIIKITDVNHLLETLTALLTEEKIYAVVHTMAVSDYTVKNITTAEDLAMSVAGAVTGFENDANLPDMIKDALINNNLTVGDSKKVSSEFDNLIIFMKKTPKVIKLIKKLQRDTILVGFKLLSGVSEDELLKAGYGLLMRNDCDFVLCNDLEQIDGDSHKGILIDKNGGRLYLSSKAQIASAVAKTVRNTAYGE